MNTFTPETPREARNREYRAAMLQAVKLGLGLIMFTASICALVYFFA